MGQAFHRKRIPVGRAPQTHGTGIRYVNMVAPRKRTAEEIAAREVQRAQEAVERAIADERWQKREESINTLVRVSKRMLETWKEATDYNDQRLVNFVGWTVANVCPFPIDADDEDIAHAFAEELTKHRRRAVYPLSLDEMDLVIDQGFRAQRAVPTEQVVAEASKAVRSAAEKSCTDEGIDIERFVEALTYRSARMRHYNTDIDSALDFVGKQFREVILKSHSDEREET
jgi:hypothetical protein